MAYKPKKKKTEQVYTPDECYSHIDNLVKDSIQHTSTWGANQEKWNKLRMRVKKSKTFPFVGCSNIRMPTAELYIRKHKASLHNVIFGTRPVAQVIPSPGGNWENARKIEKFLDHLVIDVIKLDVKSIITIDQMLEKGFYLSKPYWRTDVLKRQLEIKLSDITEEEMMFLSSEEIPMEQKTTIAMDRYEIDKSELVYEDNVTAVEKAIKDILSGKDVKATIYDVVYDFPDIAYVSPERCYVPVDSGIDPQNCQYIVHEFFKPYTEIEKNAEYKDWDKKAVSEIGEYKGKDRDDQKLSDVQKDMREGIDTINREGNPVKIWEFYGYYDINGDGVEEKCVITIAPDFGKTLKKTLIPFDSGMYPFVRHNYELIDDRWFSSRGLPELIEDIIKEIDVQHMQKIDNQTIRNSPMFVYRAGQINPNTVKFMPNQGIPVSGMNPLRDTIDVLNNNNPNVEYSYEREQMLLEGKVSELVGQIDFTLQSQINKRQPRTLGEVNLQVQNTQNVFSLDVTLFRNSFSELVNWVWELWCQYGSDEYEFSYFGKEGWEKIKLSREELQGKYKITIRGNDQNTNPQVRLQKAQQILMATTNPVYLQTGVMTPVQVANGLKRFYQELDIEGWEELVNMQPQQPPPPPPQLQIKPDFKEMTDREQAQVLGAYGVQADGQGRLMRKQEELMGGE